MARHASESKQDSGKDREAAYKDIKPLWNPTLAEVKEHLFSVLPCSFCLSGEAKKKDAEGKCMVCHGNGVIPDRDRRWRAVLFVGERHAPPPKAVEMKVDDSREREKLIDEYKDKSPEKIRAMLDQIRGIPMKVADGG